jgi:translation initiation factor IF-2
MAKIRVYELAKELGLDNKEILLKMRSLKIQVKSHMSVLTDEDVEKIRASLSEPSAVPSLSGVEEKRVAKGVIRRRTVAPAKELEEVKEQPKVDLGSLKAAKRTKREAEEPASKPMPELAEIPKEWEVEEEEAKKPRKKAKAKKAEPEPGAEPPAAITTAPETESAGPSETAPEKAPAPAPEKGAEPAPAPEVVAEKKAVKGPRKIYMKPSLRKTARAVEGEPLPIPGQAPAKAAAPGEETAEEARKRKKKKKKGKGAVEAAPPTEQFEEAPPKKKLRRKIAFKQQRGTEGMEVADVEQMYLPSRKKATGKKKAAKKTVITTPKAAKRIVKMGESITVTELAKQLEVKSHEVMKSLRTEGVETTEAQVLDANAAGLVAAAFDYEIVSEIFDENKVLGESAAAVPDKLKPRPPVVTVMGHVDHGKTSLLDTIRKTRVTEEEAGAITQHIGASLVETSSGRITFIDTPGHEAFTAMRARGAKVTDIVILVVAADDGIMPQTVEAADHAKAAGVPIIVAINKIDLPAAKPNVVKQRLSEIGIAVEGWGGETLAIECSAKTGQGVPDLLEAILLQSEMLDLKSDPDRPGQGLVIESRLDKGRGPVATVIVQQGTLRRGDTIICGPHYGKVRAMQDDRGAPVTEAGPSVPVEIMGLPEVLEPGELLMAVEDDRKARTVVEHRITKLQGERAQSAAPAKVSLEDLMARLKQGEVLDLNLILKTDTQGSAEAIKVAAEKFSREEVRVQVIHVGVGNITENDVLLASASNAVIMGFQIKVEATARKLAEQEGVQIRTYDIIYNLLDDVLASLNGMLKPVFEEKVIGKAEVRKVFRVSKVGAVAGSYVSEGVIRRGSSARVLRGAEIVYTGKVKSLKRVTEDVREVAQGLECGITLENFSKIEEGDVIEAYEVSEQSPI